MFASIPHSVLRNDLSSCSVILPHHDFLLLLFLFLFLFLRLFSPFSFSLLFRLFHFSLPLLFRLSLLLLFLPLLLCFYSHHRKLNGYRLYIVGFIPEYISPNAFAKLLPKVVDGMIENPSCSAWRNEDWVEQLHWITFLQCSDADVGDAALGSLPPYYLPLPPPSLSPAQPLTEETYREWIVARSESMDACGLCDNAHAVVGVGLAKGISGLEPLFNDLYFMIILVYECGCRDITLASFRQMSMEERLELLMSNTTTASFSVIFRERVLRFAANLSDETSVKRFLFHLRNVFLKDSVMTLNNIAMLVHLIRSTELHPLTRDYVISLALDCLAASRSIEDLDQASLIIQELESLQQDEGFASDNCQKLSSFVTAVGAALLAQKYDVLKSFNFYISSPTLEECEKIAQAILRSNVHNGVSVTTANKIFKDLVQLCTTSLSAISLPRLGELCVDSLLRSNDQTLILAAPVFFTPVANDATGKAGDNAHHSSNTLAGNSAGGQSNSQSSTFTNAFANTLNSTFGNTLTSTISSGLNTTLHSTVGTTMVTSLTNKLTVLSNTIGSSIGNSGRDVSVPSTLHISFSSAETLVLKAAQDYFNNSTGVDDVDFKHARLCLSLIQPTTHNIAREIALCEACEALSFFKLPILPAKVRSTEDPMSLIQQLLARKLITKDQKQSLQRLAERLGISSNLATTQRLDLLLSDYYWQLGEVSTSANICLDLIEYNFTDAWQV